MAGEWEVSEWLPMEAPVGPMMTWGGPTGEMEFDVGNGRWRMRRPNNPADKIRRLNGTVG